MKYITVKLTEDQVKHIMLILRDYELAEVKIAPRKSFTLRIMQKLAQASQELE